MDFVLLFATLIGGVVIGAFAVYQWMKTLAQKREILKKETQQEAKETFNAVASQALIQNTENFLTIAKEVMEKQYQQSASALQQRESSIQNLVKPIQETLEKTKQQIQEIEKERRGDYGSLDKSIENAVKMQQELSQSTTQLTQALTQPSVAGHWGEITLHRLAELSGLSEHCDFFQQESIDTAEGRLRPDMIVRLPNERSVVIDAKTSLTAYTQAFNTTEEAERKELLSKHADDIYAQVRNLSRKAYAENIRNSLDFIILFLPGDQFLTAALQQRPELLEQAMKENIILATPGSLIALLRTIAYGWREKSISENAEKIQQLSQELYERLKVFTGHFEEVGRKLSDSIDKYNQAVRSFDSRLMPTLQKLDDFKVGGHGQEIDAMKAIEKQPGTSAHFKNEPIQDTATVAEEAAGSAEKLPPA